MIICCTKEEYARLIWACARDGCCSSCALHGHCAGAEVDYSESRAEKIAALVEIVPEEVAK